MRAQIVVVIVVALAIVAMPRGASAQRAGAAPHAGAASHQGSTHAGSGPGHAATQPARAGHGPAVHHHGTPFRNGVTPTVPPFPSIATLSGPLPQGLNPPFAGPTRDLFRAGNTYVRPSPYSTFLYGYGGYADTTAPGKAMAAPDAPPATGLLQLSVTPGSTQVFVDDYYAGVADDIANRRGLELTSGPHHVELRANGYTTSSFDVDIPPHDSVRYRGALEPERPAIQPARGPSTMYVIPGCYMGNVPPRADRVGPGCDVKRARIVGK